jgi:hypothetical protein
MKKTEFEEWHNAGHSGLKQHPFESYCTYIYDVERALGKDIEDFPLDKPGQCLDRIYQGGNLATTSEKELSQYRSAVRKYWEFRQWRKRNSAHKPE